MKLVLIYNTTQNQLSLLSFISLTANLESTLAPAPTPKPMKRFRLKHAFHLFNKASGNTMATQILMFPINSHTHRRNTKYKRLQRKGFYFLQYSIWFSVSQYKLKTLSNLRCTLSSQYLKNCLGWNLQHNCCQHESQVTAVHLTLKHSQFTSRDITNSWVYWPIELHDRQQHLSQMVHAGVLVTVAHMYILPYWFHHKYHWYAVCDRKSYCSIKCKLVLTIKLL